MCVAGERRCACSLRFVWSAERLANGMEAAHPGSLECTGYAAECLFRTSACLGRAIKDRALLGFRFIVSLLARQISGAWKMKNAVPGLAPRPLDTFITPASSKVPSWTWLFAKGEKRADGRWA